MRRRNLPTDSSVGFLALGVNIVQRFVLASASIGARNFSRQQTRGHSRRPQRFLAALSHCARTARLSDGIGNCVECLAVRFAPDCLCLLLPCALTVHSSRRRFAARLNSGVRREKAAQDRRAKRLLLRPTRMLQCFRSPSGHIAPQFAFGLVASCRSGRFATCVLLQRVGGADCFGKSTSRPRACRCQVLRGSLA